MKVGIVQLREMVATAVRAAVNEVKRRGPVRKKDIPPRTPEAEKARRERFVRALGPGGGNNAGYLHSDANNFAEPLGDDSIYRRQGASGMGGWTGESRKHLQKMVEMVVREEIRAIKRR